MGKRAENDYYLRDREVQGLDRSEEIKPPGMVGIEFDEHKGNGKRV